MKSLMIHVLVACGLLTSAPAAAQELDRAYQKELTYLVAQKRALEARLKEIDAESQRKTGLAQAEVDRLNGRLIALENEADALSAELQGLSRDVDVRQEGTDQLTGVFDQARTSLKRFDVSFERGETASSNDVIAMFAAGAQAVAAGQTIQRGPGVFFLDSGERVEGQVVRLGRIAAWGISDRAAGALAPAGEGRLKLWPVDAANTARQAATSMPDHGGVFLFENLEKGAEQRKEKTVEDFLRAGGVIGWVIVALGLLGGLLIAVRGWLLWNAGRSRTALMDQTAAFARAGRLADAQKLAANARGPFARVLRDTLSAMREDRSVVEDVVSAAILRETPRIERFGNVILVFAAVSPLLGLLGTVTGMIATFDVITEFGTGDPKMLSGGISEALITTQLGLMVAIPCVLLGNLLNARAQTLMDDLQFAALCLINAHVTTGDADAVPHPSTLGVRGPELVEVTA